MEAKNEKIIVLLSVALLCLTPLFADDIFGAISRGDLKAVKSYIEVLGVSVDTKGQNDDSLFGSLIEQYYDFGDPTKLNQYINVAKYLYDKGAFVNADYNLLLSQEILSIVVDWKSERFSGQAAASSTCSPFTNLMPASTRGMNLNPSNLRHPCSASLQSL